MTSTRDGRAFILSVSIVSFFLVTFLEISYILIQFVNYPGEIQEL